jgi:hypothetical protein
LAQARDREELGHALDQAQDDGLEVRDHAEPSLSRLRVFSW